jgi:triosephosphate isomerase
MARKLIAGNWKMNGLRQSATALTGALVERAEAVGPLGWDPLICPPAPLLGVVGAALQGSAVALGGQDCHPAQSGAHTGDISAEMLADAGCRYVIVGHSERRAGHGEDDALVRAKAEAVAAVGMTPIVCVGETEAQRGAGLALAVIEAQVTGSLPVGVDGANMVIAYEPVWAIGTGRTATPEQASEMHRAIRAWLQERFGADGGGRSILYGGSVKPGNAAQLLAAGDIDGFLVGGAALDASSFLDIVRAAAKASSP